jgi:hypothetical protein
LFLALLAQVSNVRFEPATASSFKAFAGAKPLGGLSQQLWAVFRVLLAQVSKVWFGPAEARLFAAFAGANRVG